MTVRILIKSTVIAMKSLFKSEIFNWALKKTNQQIHINGELRTAISLNKLIGVTQTFFLTKLFANCCLPNIQPLHKHNMSMVI